MLKGRHVCECQAAKHDLVNNCTQCGKIVCTQEGKLNELSNRFEVMEHLNDQPLHNVTQVMQSVDF